MKVADDNHLLRGADTRIRCLMDHYFTDLGLPKNSDTVARFFALHDFFMEAVPEPQRNAERLGRLVCHLRSGGWGELARRGTTRG